MIKGGVKTRAQAGAMQGAQVFLDGERVDCLVLHGGGMSLFNMYRGLLRGLRVDVLHAPFDLVGCSAGALAILMGMQESIDAAKIRPEVMRRAYADLVLNPDLLRMVEEDGESVIDLAHVRASMRACFPDVAELAFAELATERRISIVASYSRRLQYHTFTFDRDRTPHVRVLDACLASAAIPVLCAPVGVQIDVDGELLVREFFDGALADYVKPLPEAAVHVKARTQPHDVLARYDTGVPLLNSALQLAAMLVKATTRLHRPRRQVHANVDPDMMCEPLVAAHEAAGEELATRFEVRTATPRAPPRSPTPTPRPTRAKKSSTRARKGGPKA